MNTKTQNKPDLQPQHDPISQAETVVEKAASKAKGGLLGFVANQTEVETAKVTLRQNIRQHLAEVADAAKGASEVTGELTGKAAKVAHELYTARVNGQLSPAEVSDILGDIFGVRGTGPRKGDVLRPGEKNAGKTPAGIGEEIRSRVQRAVSAYDFAHNGLSTATKYFEPFEPKDIAPMVEGLAPTADEGTTIWAFYKNVADEKRELSDDPVPFQLDAQRVAKLATSVSEDVNGIAKAMNGDMELKAAWAGMLQTLLIVNELVD